MKFSSYAKIAAYNLTYSPMRTFLAMLGIMIGTASVVALVSAGKIATEAALKEFKGLGTELMSISLSSSKEGSVGTLANQLEVVQKMPLFLQDIALIAGYANVGGNVFFGKESWDSPIIGTTGDLAKIIHISMQKGRFISNMDKTRYYCVLGREVASKVRTLLPLKKSLRIGNQLYEIIGITAKWTESSFFQASINNSIIIPIGALGIIVPDIKLSNLIMQLRKGTDIEALKGKITEYLEKEMPGYTLNFQSAEEIIRTMSSQQQIFTLLLGLIGGIALLVGGIGVMNIMLASIAERRYEIGLQLALGAAAKDIRYMFLVESATLAVVGGAAGVLLGEISTYFIAHLSGWEFWFFFSPAAIGFSVSILVSIFFGYYPAHVAAKLNPIQALKSS